MPTNNPPPWINCGGVYLMPRAGYVPMRRINAYIHSQSSMSSLQEFKGVNYPVDEIHLDSNAWGDINWSHLVESGFTGPVFTGSTGNVLATTSNLGFLTPGLYVLDTVKDINGDGAIPGGVGRRGRRHSGGVG